MEYSTVNCSTPDIKPFHSKLLSINLLLKMQKKLPIYLFIALIALSSQLRAQKCKESVEKQIKEIQELMNNLNEKQFSEKNVKEIIAWSDRFKAAYKEFDGWGIAKSTTEGTILGGMANLLAGGALGASSLGIGAVLVIGYSEFDRWASNTANIWYKANINSEIYGWLVEYVDSGKKLPVSDLLMDFMNQNSKLLENMLKEKPPTGKAKMKEYLTKHAYPLFYFIGRMEELLGPSKFVRHKWPYVQGAHGGNRMEVGYYRKVMKEQLRRELLKLQMELRKLPDCDKKTEKKETTDAQPQNKVGTTPNSSPAPKSNAGSKNSNASSSSSTSSTNKEQASIPSSSENFFAATSANDTTSGIPIGIPSDTAGDFQPMIGAGIGFGGGTNRDFGVCLGAQYQRPIGNRVGPCGSQAVAGVGLDYEYAGRNDDFNSYSQQWACISPRISLFTPLQSVDLISSLAFPIGLGTSTNKENGTGEKFKNNFSKYGASLQGGISFDVGKVNIQATTDILSFVRQTTSSADFPDQKSSSNSFSFLLNKYNQAKLSVNFPL